MSELPVDTVTLFAPTAAAYFQSGGMEHTGGAERQLYYLANMLTERGAHVLVLTINIGDQQSGPNSRLTLVNTWNSNSGLLPKVLGLVRRIVSAPSPIYLRAPSTVNAFVVSLGRIAGKRMIVGLASDLSCIRHQRAFLRNMTTWLVFKLSSQVVAQTGDQQRLLRENFGVDSVVFHNVIQRQVFSCARTVPLANRDIDALWIGSIEPRKGLEHVIEVADRLPHHKFAIVGGPRPDSVEYSNTIVRQLRERANVVPPGFVEPDTMPEWLARSKLLLHTSQPVQGGLTKEGFPNVFLEAWASGLPVVSLHVDPDRLLSAKGLGFKCETVSEAATVIEKISQDERRWATTYKSADAYIRTRDTANPSVQDELLAILAGLSTDKKARPHSG